MDNSKFFNLLFDKGQYTSFSEHFKGTKVYPINSHPLHMNDNFFTINALSPDKDLNPTETYHSATTPRRADHNVVCYRNILIEMDKIPLEDQMSIMNELDMPWTTAVYSGSKSIHFIISLETAYTEEAAFRHLIERIYKAIGGKDIVDIANKNPSRFSRFPNAPRHDKNGMKQSIVELRDRVPNAILEAWVASRIGPDVPVIREKRAPKSVNLTNTSMGTGVLSGYTLNTLMLGAQEGERNRLVFLAACDFANCDYELDEAVDRLSVAVDLPYREIYQTCKSAYSKVNKG